MFISGLSWGIIGKTVEARYTSIRLLAESELIKMDIKLKKARLKAIKKELKQRTKELKKLKKLGL